MTLEEMLKNILSGHLSRPQIEMALNRLSTIKFFPGDVGTRLAIVEQLCAICANNEQLEKLSKHAPHVYREWPGIEELRACACTMFKPADGLEVDSVVYPDGVPTPREIK